MDDLFEIALFIIEEVFLLGLFLLVIIVGSVLGWVAFFSFKKQHHHLSWLERELMQLTKQFEEFKRNHSPQTDKPAPANKATQTDQPTQTITNPQPSSHAASLNIWAASSTQAIKTPPAPADTDEFAVHKTAKQPSKPSLWLLSFKANWMIWLGGLSIGLAGIFLAKYSIDNGWLGPIARISITAIVGFALHLIALRWRIRLGHNDVFAALAGGASIMLYAALLAALHLYHLVDPGLVFLILVVISLATSLLALLHGPVLAAIGILGAYLVPVLIGGDGNINHLIGYSLITTLSALLLIRFVYRNWLWVGTLIGAGFWWLMSLASASGELTLAYILVLMYALVAIELWDWRLITPQSLVQMPISLVAAIKQDCLEKPRLHIALLVLLFAWVVSLANAPLTAVSLAIVFILTALMLHLAYRQPPFLWLAWGGFLATSLGLLLFAPLFSSIAFGEAQWFVGLLLGLSLIHFAAIWASQLSHYPGYWASLGLLAPLVLLIAGYFKTTFIQDGYWAATAFMLGAIYFNWLYRKRNELADTVLAGIILSGHFAYTLVVVFVAQEASLTLALAAQVISLVWLDRYFQLPILPYLVKLLLGVVVTRLTLNPWLLTYPADIHWSLWTYGGSLLCVVVAAFIVKERQSLQPWLHAVIAHLLVLTSMAEIRYQLYDGQVFALRYDFIEAALNTVLWGALGLVYRLKMKVAQRLSTLYSWISAGLLLAALLNYVLFLLWMHNPLFTADSISTTPIFNALLLAYGLPVFIAAFAYWHVPFHWRRSTGLVAAILLMVFVSIEVRHLWQGKLDAWQPMLAGELYTYSMVWLLLAIAAFLASLWFQHKDLYRGSLVLLVLVVIKVLLIDTAGLTSLWRIGSLMGLGMALLGLAWLHQQIDARWLNKSASH